MNRPSDIFEIAKRDTVFSGCIQAFLAGELSWEDALMEIIKQNDKYCAEIMVLTESFIPNYINTLWEIHRIKTLGMGQYEDESQIEKERRLMSLAISSFYAREEVTREVHAAYRSVEPNTTVIKKL